MSFIHIKKIQKPDDQEGMRDFYAVPSVAIATPQGKKLIPNPSGAEASLFDTLEEAEAAIRRAGFDYIFEGKKTYTLSQAPVVEKVSTRGQAPEQAIPVLIRNLREREPSLVANSAFALGAMKAHAALEPLSEILGHDDPAVRKAVAEAMSRMGYSALPVLRDAFVAARSSPHKNAPYIRLTVINALLEMLQPVASATLTEQLIPLVLDALEDESWLVRSQAALAIGHAAQVLETERAKGDLPKKSLKSP